MTGGEKKKTEAPTEIPTKFVSEQKMGIRDFFRLSKCSGGLHIWIPPNIIEHFNLEAGDQVYVRLDEVQYHNLREVQE
jgi:hypothetical protein